MKGLKWLMAAALTASLVGQISPAQAAAASIVDYYWGSYLLSDGTVWTQNVDDGGYDQLDFDLVEIQSGYGITKDGKLARLRTEPAVLTEKTGVVKISGDYYLNDNGDIRSLGGDGKVLYTGIANFNNTDGGTVLLTREGVLKASSGFGNNIAQFGSADEVVSIDSIASWDGVDKVAVVLQSGKVLLYNRYNFDYDDLTKYVPVTVAENAADAKFDGAGSLVVLLKDGTVWKSNSVSLTEVNLTSSFPGLSGVQSLIAVSGEGMDITAQDGKVMSYDVNSAKLAPLTLPSVSDISFQMDQTSLTVGDKTKVEISEKWTGGSTRKVPLKDADITIEKPALLQKLSDGNLKALAVGETKVTVKSGGVSKTLEVSISSDDTITTGALINGSMYLPVQAVFKQLGASVEYNAAAKIFSIKLNGEPVQLQLGSDTAMINGKKVKMSGKMQTVDSVKVFPAALLKTAFGAGLDWNSDIQVMTISFGKAEMRVATKQTAAIYKKQAQGSLVSLIGKSYWINFFDTDYRFQKVTIVDVLPDYNGYFALSLKFSSGQVLNTIEMTGNDIISALTDKEQFLTADPYKTYKWSSATWAKIKAGQISTGMTKQQVELSWGTPVNKSAVEGSGIRVETWQYSGYNYVTFTNGVVSYIYTS